MPPYNTSFSALEYGPACPQQPALQLPPVDLPAETLNYLTVLLGNTLLSAEDCACVVSSVQCSRTVVTGDQ